MKKLITYLLLLFFFLILGCTQNIMTENEPIMQPSISLSQIEQQLQFKITWNAKEKKALLQRDHYIITIIPKSNKAWIQSEEKQLDFPAYISNQEIYIPYTFYEEIVHSCPFIIPTRYEYIPYTYSTDQPILQEDPPNLIYPTTPNKQIPNIPSIPTTPSILTTPSKFKYPILIDAGHGGKDPGAISKQGYKEKDFTLSIALKLKHALQQKNIPVQTTRDTDIFISLDHRVYMANKNPQTPCLISIHLNSTDKGDAQGYEFWIAQEDSGSRHENSLRLAKLLQKQFKNKIPLQDRGIKKNKFRVLQKTIIPAVLIECCFLSSPTDLAWINQDKSQNLLVDAITQAILQY
ncbi:MAG TPA: N-acetylmuramoyl-L-alanine amidase [Planctomycetota bacterium]|nr:N-acetylmuramoyl-L-alanine amidase [Planctomycetota bacterium]HRU51867.1 N-acetylmuramoyl-L-alanine amidase [Planctomycetota bacterium]